MKMLMAVTALFALMELAIKTMLRAATARTQVAAEVRGGDEELANGAYAQPAKPWLTAPL
jgi:hypothetical protein